jgi:transcription termination/antitermination protein NusG
MHQWYVVHVLSTHEKKVKRALEEHLVTHGVREHIEQILLPIEKVSEVKGGARKITEKHIWPGYILLKMQLNDQTWSYVKETPGVIGFLGGDVPVPLTDIEINNILDDLRSKQEKVVEKHQFHVGSNVKIIDGVFVNFIGTVTDVSHEKGLLSVKVVIFGRETQVDDLNFSNVEAVDEGNNQQ